MAEAKESVKLFGMWASPWVRRVKIALKLKGIPYDYLEENLTNKSKLLLQYNPVKKLVPILVHDGRPIPESLIIIEYFDETWKNSPNLLPLDPCHRAIVRFWADFLNWQVFEKLRDVVKTPNDEAEEKTIKCVQENMSKVEANVKDLRSCSNEESMEVLDILMATLLYMIEGVEEAIDKKFLDPEKYPEAFSWMKAHQRVPAVEETKVDHENHVKFLRILRKKFRNRPALM